MPHTLSAADWEGQARSQYRAGDYDAALNSISHAIVAFATPVVSYLELQIAAEEKLGHLPEALALTKSLILSHPSDITGYIRAERILRKLDRPEAALKICQRGLKAVPSDNASISRLRQRAEHLERSLIMANMKKRSVDPFERLPLEMIQIVLSDFTFPQRL